MSSAKRYPATRAAIYSGLIGAVVSLVVETPINWFLFEQTPWAAMRMAAAIVLGPSVLPPPATFDLRIGAVAGAVHVALSIIFAVALAPVVSRRRPAAAALVGAFAGVIAYAINLYGFTALLFAWFAALRGGVTLFSHVVLGAVIGWAYAAVLDREPR